MTRTNASSSEIKTPAQSAGASHPTTGKTAAPGKVVPASGKAAAAPGTGNAAPGAQAAGGAAKPATAAAATLGKGKAFFDRGDQVASTGNWDFAIDMYLEGLTREPGNVARGHKPLREAAMKRKAGGGKGPGMMEQFKHKQGKDPAANLIAAVFMLGKDPGSLMHMEQAMNAAVKLQLPEVIKFYADILMESQRQAKKPRMKILQSIVTAYSDLTEYASAIAAGEMARKVDPDNGQIGDILRDLSAKYTIKQGKYGQEGSFTKGVADLKGQQERNEKGNLLQSKDFLQQQIEKAKADYLGSPLLPGKINAYVDALLKMEDEGFENEAVDVLLKANKDTQAYQFKMRVGDIKIIQIKRQIHNALQKGDKAAAAELGRKRLEFELVEYAERSANYPTDLTIKFDLGMRQYVAGKFDDAISCLQQAARDPRRHVQALGYLGQAFAKKQWYREASETYERALQSDMTEERVKEIRYNLGDVLEKMGDKEDQPGPKREALQKSQEQFSTVAQLDFQFKDVRVRLEAVRKKCDAMR